MKKRLIKKLVSLISVCLLSVNMISQIEDIQVSDFFKLYFYPKESGSIGYFPDPDSLKNSRMEKFGENMYACSQYLFTNYSYAGKIESREAIKKALPDTIQAVNIFNNYLDSDTLFRQLYVNFLKKKEIPAIHIDSFMNIACRFFYLHRLPNQKIVMHTCAGINESHKLPQNEFSPYYNAFAFSVIRNSGEKGVEWLSSFESDLVYSADTQISDTELEKLRNQNYEILKSSEDFRKNIINEYLRRKEFLNFKLIY